MERTTMRERKQAAQWGGHLCTSCDQRVASKNRKPPQRSTRKQIAQKKRLEQTHLKEDDQ
jgi:hypothetical protein